MNAQDSALALMFKTHPAPAERLTRWARRCSRCSTPTPASRSSPTASCRPLKKVTQAARARRARRGTRRSGTACTSRPGVRKRRSTNQAQFGPRSAVERRQIGEPAEDRERLGVPRLARSTAWSRLAVARAASPRSPGPTAGTAHRRGQRSRRRADSASFRSHQIDVRKPVRFVVAHEHRPVERRHRPRMRRDARVPSPSTCAYSRPNSSASLLLQVLEADIAGQHHARHHRGNPASDRKCRNDQAGDDDAAEPEVDDEGRADPRAPVGERREDRWCRSW